MILDIDNPVQWQVRDDKYPTLKPWYTHGMLTEIDKWNLKDKKILEWGSGWSTVYWAYHCKEVKAIETNLDWFIAVSDYLKTTSLTNWEIIYRDCNEGDQDKIDIYTKIPMDKSYLYFYAPDIVCIDGVLRHECLVKSLTLERPLTIIHDNWMQDGFVCPASEELMAPYEIHNFIQEDHTDNHGRKWATAYWELK